MRLVRAALLAALARGAAGDEAHDYCIVGAGLAGVQLAHFLEQAGRDYVVLERGAAAGSFFRRFPRHRNLISINKRHTGRGGSQLAQEHNLRHDWHSLLSSVRSGDVDEELLFANMMDEDRLYPKADVLADYADKLARHWKLNLRTRAEVTAIRNMEKAFFGTGGGFVLEIATPDASEQLRDDLEHLRTELSGLTLKAVKNRARELGVDEGQIDGADDAADPKTAAIELCVQARAQDAGWRAEAEQAAPAYRMSCRWVVLAAGFSKPHVPDIPGLERHSISYNDMPAERSYYANKTVAILGAGNAGFETFKAIMEDAAYVHIHGRSHIRMAWETHYVGDLRSVNVVPVDNYQLKSQDIVSLPSPINLTKAATVVRKEVMRDGREAVCFINRELEGTAKLLEGGAENLPPHLRDGPMEGHSLTFEERFSNVDHYCYDVVIRCTGFEVDTSIFQLATPLATQGGRAQRKYLSLSPEYESVSAPGLYAAGTLAHVRDFRRSSGGFVHGFRYTARALFKLLERKNHDVPWPSTQVLLDPAAAESQSGLLSGLLSGPFRGRARRKLSLAQKITERMDTSSGLYQMFNNLCDLAILPLRDADTAPEDATAEYLEEVPLDLVPQFVEEREYVVLTMEYGQDFHGHERVLRQNRVFHNFDPEKAHTSQFLHPILRYYSPGVLSRSERNETASHHVLEDIYTNFTNPTIHVKPMTTFLERFRQKPLDWADLPTKLSWPGDTSKEEARGRRRKERLECELDVDCQMHVDADRPLTSDESAASSTAPMRGKKRAFAAPHKHAPTHEEKPAAAAAEHGLSKEDMRWMKAKELRDLLKEMGLPTTGSKAQLMERLEKSAQQPEDDDGGEAAVEDSATRLSSEDTSGEVSFRVQHKTLKDKRVTVPGAKARHKISAEGLLVVDDMGIKVMDGSAVVERYPLETLTGWGGIGKDRFYLDLGDAPVDSNLQVGDRPTEAQIAHLTQFLTAEAAEIGDELTLRSERMLQRSKGEL